MIEMSVIIPTYNRCEQLQMCLDALDRQTQPASDFEVVVVVDGSTDGTQAMLATRAAAYQLRVISQANGGQCAALNTGIEAACGRYCLILDDDIVADPKLVAEHIQAQRAKQGIVGIGQIALALPPGADWFARCFEQAWNDHYSQLNRGAEATWIDCYSGNMSVARATLLAVGGFATNLARGYDVELGYRFEQHGEMFAYIPGALGTQDQRKGCQDLVADAEKSGAACVELYRQHPPMLPRLFGTFAEAPPRMMLLRRILLAVNISPHLAAIISRFLKLRGGRCSWYHLIHSYSFWRGVRQAVGNRDTWRRLTQGVPILMYHAFGAVNETPSRYIIPHRRFALQIAFLKWAGYQVLSLEELLEYRRHYRLAPARSVVITIDDGYADNRTRAYSVLRRYGFPATIFLVSHGLGAANQWDNGSELTGRSMLSWQDVHEMSRGGIQFGAHTQTHPTLVGMPDVMVQQEIGGSREELERALRLPIQVFSYPYGKHNQAIRAIVEQAGFLGACGIERGLNTPLTPLYALRRVEIYGTDSLFRFIRKLWLGDRPLF